MDVIKAKKLVTGVDKNKLLQNKKFRLLYAEIFGENKNKIKVFPTKNFGTSKTEEEEEEEKEEEGGKATS